MNGLDYWRICEALSVIQAALLIIGLDPGEDGLEDNVEEWDASNRPQGYNAVKSALVNAIQGRRLSATLSYRAREMRKEIFEEHDIEYADMIEGPGIDEIEIRKTWLLKAEAPGIVQIDSNTPAEYENGPVLICEEFPSWYYSTVKVDDLREWLKGRGISSGFFFLESKSEREYLDKQHERYAPKLAAAVLAWESVKETPGKSPKSQLVKWLHEHANDFELTDKEGTLNQQGIEEVAKVANWRPGGGAPKTPG